MKEINVCVAQCEKAALLRIAYTKKELLEFLKMMISNNDKWATRALERIYQGQEADEVDDQETRHLNSVGFNSHDAPILTSIYKSYKEHNNHMTPKMLDVVKRMMAKYAGQLFRAEYFDMDKMNKIYEQWLAQNKKASRIARSILAKVLVAARKIDHDFILEFDKAIRNNEMVSFDYVNKQGKKSLVTMTPKKIERKWGKMVVTGITTWGKEFSFLLDSMGDSPKGSEERNDERVNEGRLVVLRDNCNFKEEIRKAIDEGNKIQFTYLMKNGNRIKVTMKPAKLEVKWGQDVCTGETNQGERSYLISSMGDNSLAKSELFSKYSFLKNAMFYTKLNGSYYFFKPTALVNDQVECDKYDSKVYTSSYTDGDSEDGGTFGWEQEYIQYKTYPGRVVGKELLEIKGEKLYLNGTELKQMGADQHLSRVERGERKTYRNEGNGWKRWNGDED